MDADRDLGFRLWFYDTDGSTELARHEGGSPTSRTVSRPNLNPGTYFVRVERLSGQGNYTIVATLNPAGVPSDREPNDSAETAQDLTPNSQTTGHLGYYSGGRTDTVDWHSLTSTFPGTLSVNVEAEPTLSYRLWLFDVNGGTDLARNEGGMPASRTVSRPDLNPGTYYVRVERLSGHGTYVISNTLRPHPFQEDAELNDTADAAVNLALGGRDTGLLGYYCDRK
ncbi:MAG: hypothetical protein NUW23_08250 [Firmicutes bacterium]|nr:hypothetical protein [Bacillota bacterium]